MKNSFVTKTKAFVLSIALGLMVVWGSFSGSVSADLYDSPFYSGKLVVKSSDVENIPEEGEIISSGDGMYLLEFESPEAAETAYLAMEENADIIASPEASVVICSQNETDKKVPLETENALFSMEAQVPDFSGQDVIALIDTGASLQDTEMRFSVLSDEGNDENGHGTNMIKAIKSVDENAKIVSIKALNKNGIGSISSVYTAIKLATRMNVKLINLSLVAKSVDENAIIKDAIRDALNNNIIVVGAAGNMGEDASGYIPGCINSVIIAGSCDENGVRLLSSNYGDTVDWNVVSDSTSEASAKLSAFINKNCVADSSLNVTLFEARGQGLIFSTYKDDSGEVSKEDVNIIQDEGLDLEHTEWKTIDVDSIHEDDKKALSENGKIKDLKISKEGDLICVTTGNSVVPDDGTFVPAAWEYGQILNTSYIRIVGTEGENGTNKSFNPVTITPNANGTYTASKIVQSTNDYYLVGYTPTYIPGAFEQSQETAHLGTQEVSNESFRYISRYLDSLYDLERPFGEMTYHSSAKTGLSDLKAWPVPETNLKYLYKLNIRLFVDNMPFNEEPYRVGTRTSANSVWYEEGKIGTSRSSWVGTSGNKVYAAEIGLTLRKYKVFYQLGSDENNLYCAGEGCVGSPFDFTSAQREADNKIINKRLKWDYSAFGNETRPLDTMEIIPNKDQITAIDESGEEYYRYVVVPQGSIETADAEITVTEVGSKLPVLGVGFNLMTAEGQLIEENLLTDENGKVSISDLYWAESLDCGDRSGEYVLIPVSAPAGFTLPREIPFSVTKEIVENGELIRAQRQVEIMGKPLSLESVVNTPDSPGNVFVYEIKGVDVMGKERTMRVVCSGRYERNVPAGEYTVSVLGGEGYKLLKEENLEGFDMEKRTVNLVDSERGSIRFIWECEDSGSSVTKDVAVNRFYR